MIKIGIVGSRRWFDKKHVELFIDLRIKKYGKENITIISGGAKGADKLGKEVAIEKKLNHIR